VSFDILEPAMPKLPNTLSKGYLDNYSRSIIERYSGTEIGFLGRFYVFKNILNMGFVPNLALLIGYTLSQRLYF